MRRTKEEKGGMRIKKIKILLISMLIITAVYLGDKVLRVVDGAGFEPATSAMPTPRSFQADLPAQPRVYIFKTIRLIECL